MPAHVVLIAGTVKPNDRPGHHDYLGGCRLLQHLLAARGDVTTTLVTDGWPQDPAVLDGASAWVIYDRGGGRQGFLATPERVACLESAARRGVGLAVLHQTVAFPAAHVALGQRLLGGGYATGVSRRGHWRSAHRVFPAHPVTRGVEPWAIRDGWFNRIAFDPAARIVPLLWSGRRHAGSADGGAADIVAWVCERPDGGRSFAFTGLDAHTAWAHAGLRRLVVGGVLWSAGLDVPVTGAAVEVTPAQIAAWRTPRRRRFGSLPRKLLRRLSGRRW